MQSSIRISCGCLLWPNHEVFDWTFTTNIETNRRDGLCRSSPALEKRRGRKRISRVNYGHIWLRYTENRRSRICRSSPAQQRRRGGGSGDYSRPNLAQKQAHLWYLFPFRHFVPLCVDVGVKGNDLVLDRHIYSLVQQRLQVDHNRLRQQRNIAVEYLRRTMMHTLTYTIRKSKTKRRQK